MCTGFQMRWISVGFLRGIVLAGLLASGSSAHSAEPQWIWGTEDANQSANDGLVLFKKNFNATAQPTSAVLSITCDDQYVIRLNGRLVGVNERWQDVERYEVSQLIQKGENSIFIRSRNLTEGPAGLLASLKLEFANGDTSSVHTDDTWDASIQKSGTWNPDVAKIKRWKKAFELGDQASTGPWRDSLKTSESIKTVGRPEQPRERFELRDGDRVLFLGNTLIEREQRYGYWEAALTTRNPNKNIVFRNLGWSGDTVLGEARARFGNQSEGFAHLEVHVQAVNPSLIVCSYGSNAAFAGPDGIEQFIEGYNTLLDSLEATGATIVLLAPLRHEKFNGRYLSKDYNSHRDLYAQAIKQLAKDRQCIYVELPQSDGDQWTDNGMHLSEYGYWASAAAFEEAVGYEPRTISITVDAEKKTAKATNATLSDVDFKKREFSFVVTGDITPVNVPEEFALRMRNQQRDIANRLIRPELKVTGLPPGEYLVTVDGVESPPLSSGVLALGIVPSDQLPTNELVQAIRKKNELYFHRWRPQNETYLFLFRKHEQGNNAVEIPMFDPLVADIEQRIAELKQTKPVKYTIRRKL